MRAGPGQQQYVWLRWPAQTFTYFMRGTPLLIQVYLIYYGVAQLEWVQARWDAVWPWTNFKEPFFCTLLSFSPEHRGLHRRDAGGQHPRDEQGRGRGGAPWAWARGC